MCGSRLWLPTLFISMWLLAVVCLAAASGLFVTGSAAGVVLLSSLLAIGIDVAMKRNNLKMPCFHQLCSLVEAQPVLEAIAASVVSGAAGLDANNSLLRYDQAPFALVASISALSSAPFVFGFSHGISGRMTTAIPSCAAAAVGAMCGLVSSSSGTHAERFAIFGVMGSYTIAGSAVLLATWISNGCSPRGEAGMPPTVAARQSSRKIMPARSLDPSPAGSLVGGSFGTYQPGRLLRDGHSDAASTASKAGSLVSVSKPSLLLPIPSHDAAKGMRSQSVLLAQQLNTQPEDADDETSTPVERLIHLLRPLKALAQDAPTRSRIDACLDVLYNTSDLFQVDYDKLLAQPSHKRWTSGPRKQSHRGMRDSSGSELPPLASQDSQASRHTASDAHPEVVGREASKDSSGPIPGGSARSRADAGVGSVAGLARRSSRSSGSVSKEAATKVALGDDNTRKWLATQLSSGAPTSGKAQVRVRKTQSSRHRTSQRRGRHGDGRSTDSSSYADSQARDGLPGSKMQVLHASSRMGSLDSSGSSSGMLRSESGHRMRPMGSQARMVTGRMSSQSLFRAHSLHVLNKKPSVSFDIPGVALIDAKGGVQVPGATAVPSSADGSATRGTGSKQQQQAQPPKRYTLHMRHASMPHMKSFVVAMPLVRESSEENLAQHESFRSKASDSGDEKAVKSSIAAPETSKALVVSKPVTSTAGDKPEGPLAGGARSPAPMVRAISAADIFEELKTAASPKETDGPGQRALSQHRGRSRSSLASSHGRNGNGDMSVSSRGTSSDMDRNQPASVDGQHFAGPEGSGSSKTHLASSRSSSQSVDLPPYTYLDVGPTSRSVAEALGGSLNWDFDVFALESASERRPLSFLGNHLFQQFGCIEQYGLPEPQRTAFLNTLEHHYCFDPARRNPYHCSTHAADVTQGVAHFLTSSRIKSVANSLDKFALLFAAMVHDFRHPGCNNAYLVKSSHDLALRYNDESVLECHHVSEGFQLLHHPRFDMMVSLEDEERRRVRYVAIQAVRVTDLAVGARLVNTFKSKLATTVSLGKTSEEDRQLVLNMVLKCSDVSHPARPLTAHLKWTDLITEEFYRQGDFERRLGLPISPLCDRADHNLPKSQLGFIQFVVRPSYAVFTEYLGASEHLEQLDANVEFWKVEAESGDPSQKRRMTDIAIHRRDDEDGYSGPGGYLPLVHAPLLRSEMDAQREAMECQEAESYASFEQLDGGAAGGAPMRERQPASGAGAGGGERAEDSDEEEDEEAVVMVAHEGQIDEILARTGADRDFMRDQAAGRDRTRPGPLERDSSFSTLHSHHSQRSQRMPSDSTAKGSASVPRAGSKGSDSATNSRPPTPTSTAGASGSAT